MSGRKLAPDTAVNRREAEPSNKSAAALALENEALRADLSAAKAAADALRMELNAVQLRTQMGRRHIATAIRLQQELHAANLAKDLYQQDLQRILQSKSWQMTEPIRRTVFRLRSLLGLNPQSSRPPGTP